MKISGESILVINFENRVPLDDVMSRAAPILVSAHAAALAGPQTSSNFYMSVVESISFI